ncbi:MAG: hypothetical protein VX000_16130, partial [Myxococcota bacterium]|nr:hypothetical protein [Myxococcota bacterium]
MIVLPPAPFPPLGTEAAGTLDLGVRLRDQLFVSAAVGGPLRQALAGRLGTAVETEQWHAAARLLEAFLDSFPVASLVDAARMRWTEGPDPQALAVLARAGELVCLAMDWKAGPDGCWPWPSDAWMEGTVGTVGVSAVEQRDAQDGAELLAVLLGEVPVQEGILAEVLPPHATVSGERLAERREELCGWLARGELTAVRVTGEVPADPATLLALGEIRLEGARQAALERFGVSGLRAGSVVDWKEQLRPQATAPVHGPLVPRCEATVLPGTPSRLARGDARPVGWLLWNAPSAPVAVQPAAIAVLRELDGERDLAAIAAAL